MDQNNQQPAYQAPQPSQQPMNQAPQGGSNGLSVAALVCGIVAIIGAWIPVVCYFTFVLAILGIVFGVKGMKQSKLTGTGHGLAVAGLVLGIIGTALGAIGVICAICVLAAAGAVSSQYGDLLDALSYASLLF